MGSSAKTGKKIFRLSQEHFLHKSAIWDRRPPTYTSNTVCMCAVGFKGPKSEFNYLDSFKSYGIFSDFVVPAWSLWSPRCPCHPYVIPVIHTSFPLSPHCPHSPQKVPMWSPWLWSPLSPLGTTWTLSLFSPHCPRCPHIIPTSSRRSPHHPQPPRYPSNLNQ